MTINSFEQGRYIDINWTAENFKKYNLKKLDYVLISSCSSTMQGKINPVPGCVITLPNKKTKLELYKSGNQFFCKTLTH